MRSRVEDRGHARRRRECAPVRRGDDHALEGKIEQRTKRGQGSLTMPRRGPNAQFASRGRQGVGENEGALLGQPERCLITAASVVEGNDASGKPAAGLDPLQRSVLGMS